MGPLLSIGVLVGLVGAGCRIEIDYGGSQFACVETDECPPGTRCVDQVCLPGEGSDSGMTGAPFLAGYTRRKLLTLQSTRLPADVADLPIAVRIVGDAELAGGARLDGADIVFAAADGTTRLPHEIELYDPVGNVLVAWVRIPLLSATVDTSIHVYYGAPDATDDQDRAATWAGEFAGVWHLGPAGFGDSARGNDAAPNAGAGPEPAVGIAGPARKFDAAEDTLVIGDPADGSLDFGTDSFSYSVWVNVTSSLGEFDIPWHKGGSSAGTIGYDFELGTSEWNAFVADGTTLAQIPIGDEAELVGGWVHLVAVIDRAQASAQIYVNGAPAGGADIAAIGSLSTQEPATIGQIDFPFFGLIDEVRVYLTAQTADRIAADYTTTSQSDFVAVGVEQTAP